MRISRRRDGTYTVKLPDAERELVEIGRAHV